MGEGPDEFKEALAACKSGDNYVKRMKSYFGVQGDGKKKRGRK